MRGFLGGEGGIVGAREGFYGGRILDGELGGLRNNVLPPGGVLANQG